MSAPKDLETAPARPSNEALPVSRVVLAGLTAIGPVSFQIFLPALPAIQAGFGVEAGTAQLALSLSMLGIALATLAYGPLSDRFGRRPALIGGMILLIAGTLLCAAAPNIWVLIAGRIVQAAGGASGMVVSRAIVVDVYGRERARAVLGGLMSVMVAGPLLATPLGGVLADTLGWRANFVAIALAAGAMLAYLLVRLPETRVVAAASSGGPLAGFSRLLRLPAFNGFALQSGFAMAAFMAFTTAAPYYLQHALGIGATGFGLYATVVTLGFLAGSLSATRAARRISTERLVLLGSAVALAASLIAAALAFGGAWTVWALIGPAALVGYANGLSMPSAQAGAVSVLPELAGTASGLSGFMGTMLGALATQVVGTLQNGTPYPIVAGMAVASAGALAAALLATRASRPAPIANELVAQAKVAP